MAAMRKNWHKSDLPIGESTFLEWQIQKGRELGITDQSLLKTIADSCIRNDGGYRQLTHAEILDILEECY